MVFRRKPFPGGCHKLNKMDVLLVKGALGRLLQWYSSFLQWNILTLSDATHDNKSQTILSVKPHMTKEPKTYVRRGEIVSCALCFVKAKGSCTRRVLDPALWIPVSLLESSFGHKWSTLTAKVIHKQLSSAQLALPGRKLLWPACKQRQVASKLSSVNTSTTKED